MKKEVGSGFGSGFGARSGSISQRYGSTNQNVTDPQDWPEQTLENIPSQGEQSKAGKACPTASGLK
jgi:hypothetical protein